MHWWLGRGDFADHGCILSTREQLAQEAKEDARDEVGVVEKKVEDGLSAVGLALPTDVDAGVANAASYDDRVPPIALWIAGSDLLIDGIR